nr:DUF4893 domain-containing protein [uncultured Sphingosinicella sp.]
MRFACFSICLAVSVAGCASKGGSAPQIARATATPDWRTIATEDDRGRLRNWRTAWMNGLRKAQATGHGQVLVREGVLLNPDAAVEWRDPPAGDYRCRVIKVGAKSQGMLDYVSYPPFMCRIRREGGLMSFAKMTGSQRPIGHFLPSGGQQRMVFLGTLQLGDEPRALQYGRDRERDMAGVVERIGENRWRLVLPYPHFESTIDVLELVPALNNIPRNS